MESQTKETKDNLKGLGSMILAVTKQSINKDIRIVLILGIMVKVSDSIQSSTLQGCMWVGIYA